MPLAIDRIIGEALAKNREERYQSVEELIAALKHLKSESESSERTARAASHPGRTRRAVWTTSAIAIAGTAAVVGGRYSGFFRSRAASGTVRALAVLPLKRLTTDSSDDKLLELGIADTVISKVSRFSGLTVRPTSSVRKYAAQDADTLAVARELRVDAVLEGTLQRSGGKLRVTVDLLRVDTGASLWSDHRNRYWGRVGIQTNSRSSLRSCKRT